VCILGHIIERAVWCGVVCCVVVWCGVLWYSVVCGMVWSRVDALCYAATARFWSSGSLLRDRGVSSLATAWSVEETDAAIEGTDLG